MDIEKLIDRLYTKQQSYDSYTDSELAHVMEDAIAALSTLQAENEKLRGELEYEQEHANAYYEECGQWEAENEQLRNEVERQRRSADDRKHLYENAERAYMKVVAELEQVKHALAMMWFAYVNSDKETPHSYETEAIEEAERLLGPWEECMPKYLRRGQKED